MCFYACSFIDVDNLTCQFFGKIRSSNIPLCQSLVVNPTTEVTVGSAFMWDASWCVLLVNTAFLEIITTLQTPADSPQTFLRFGALSIDRCDDCRQGYFMTAIAFRMQDAINLHWT